jgi:hypothetical protein
MFYKEKHSYHPAYQNKDVTIRIMAAEDGQLRELAWGSFNVSGFCNSIH